MVSISRAVVKNSIIEATIPLLSKSLSREICGCCVAAVLGVVRSADEEKSYYMGAGSQLGGTMRFNFSFCWANDTLF